jgi:iron complex outermembrane receptor protein
MGVSILEEALLTEETIKNNKERSSISAGSFSTIRGTMDFTGHWIRIKHYCIVLMLLFGSKSFRDLQAQKAILISPSFSYIPNGDCH